MKAAGIFILLLVWHTGFSQWSDTFEDGDFIINPSWNGDTADFRIVNYALKLSAPAESGTAYLSTPSENINNATWQYSVKLDFNPSSNNYAKVYLVASKSNLNGGLDGYFVKLGGTTDEVSLYRQDGLAVEEIIDGNDGRLSLSSVSVQVLVSRSEDGLWNLSSKLEGEPDWHIEGNVIDGNYFQSSYFGVHCTYTSTRSTKFSFDSLIVTGEPYVDIDSPLVDTVFASGSTKVIISFNEQIESNSALTTSNYLLNGNAMPNSVLPMSIGIELDFDTLPVINSLHIEGIRDIAQNTMADTLVQFIFINPLPAVAGDIIINEVMADPTPSVSLPDIEYIELFNASTKAINMTRWSYSDKTSIAKLTDIILLPDSLLILCSKNNMGMFSGYGNVSGLSPWPTLNNSGDSLSLVNEQGEIIDVIVYTEEWYNDLNKKGGGWSLERVDPYHPCSGILNWRASINSLGGTPGERNSVFFTEDNSPPEIIGFQVAIDSLLVTFNEPISINLGSISFNSTNLVKKVDVNYNQVLVTTSQPFLSGQFNNVVFSTVADCFNNSTQNLSVSFTPDFEPPKIDTVFSNYPNTLEVYFDETVITPRIENFLIGMIGSPASLDQDLNNQSHITLNYDSGLNYADEYNLITDDVEDKFNNMTNQSQYLFKYLPLSYPGFAELLITEIMADPSPAIGLPEHEYIELANKTSKRLLLKGMVIADAKDMALIPSGIMEPYERVILTGTASAEVFSGYARTFGIPNWPTLNNTSDQIMILDTGLQVVNYVSYSNDWYVDDEKKDGGWSLELIDEENYCNGKNVWRASDNILGGTPGEANSIQSIVPDLVAPKIVEAFAISADSIVFKFNKSLGDQLPVIASPNLEILNFYFSKYSKDEIIIHVKLMQPRVAYEISVTKTIDCAGNINNEEVLKIYLPEDPESGEIALSEILFNPRSTGKDFIEVYNNSPKYVSLLNWYLSNSTSFHKLTDSRILPPYSFRVFAPSHQNIIVEYPNSVSDLIFEQEIPSMPNEEGIVVLLNEERIMLDSVSYREDWHYSYLASVDGISLERIDYGQHTNLSSNWASAAATENFATPGYKNSQSIKGSNSTTLSISPEVIVPDGSGVDNFATISLSVLGSMATITIYNLQGQAIKQIANNSLVGGSSTFVWDGRDNTGGIVALGHYIVVANTISSSGATQTYRKKIVVGTGF